MWAAFHIFDHGITLNWLHSILGMCWFWGQDILSRTDWSCNIAGATSSGVPRSRLSSWANTTDICFIYIYNITGRHYQKVLITNLMYAQNGQSYSPGLKMSIVPVHWLKNRQNWALQSGYKNKCARVRTNRTSIYRRLQNVTIKINIREFRAWPAISDFKAWTLISVTPVRDQQYQTSEHDQQYHRLQSVTSTIREFRAEAWDEAFCFYLSINLVHVWILNSIFPIF